nr:patatin-like phospholipase family protein [Rhodococcus sp. (in: high G+C Gram-positive bacteria)]
MSRTAIVIGCGGTIGGAWIVAALHALTEQTGLDPRDADILQGTSAGAEIITMLAGGARVQDLVDMHRGVSTDGRLRAHVEATPPNFPPVPKPALPKLQLLRSQRPLTRMSGLAPTGRADATWLETVAKGFSDSTGRLAHPGARMVALDRDSGQRVVFGGPTAPPATADEALRASWAIPGWMPPVVIANRTYIDGGAASTASVDLIEADEADIVYVLAPMASKKHHRAPGFGGFVENRALRRPMTKVLDAEIALVRARGTQVVPILPSSDDLAGLGSHFMKRSYRRAAFESAMTTAPETVRRSLATDRALS